MFAEPSRHAFAIDVKSNVIHFSVAKEETFAKVWIFFTHWASMCFCRQSTKRKLEELYQISSLTKSAGQILSGNQALLKKLTLPKKCQLLNY